MSSVLTLRNGANIYATKNLSSVNSLTQWQQFFRPRELYTEGHFLLMNPLVLQPFYRRGKPIQTDIIR